MEWYGRGWKGDVFECGVEIWMQEVNLKEIWVQNLKRAGYCVGHV